MTPLYELRAGFLPPAARVLSFEGTECISALYEFRITIALRQDEALDLDLDGATGQRATLRINDQTTATPQFAYHGIVACLELLGDRDGYSILRVTLVPSLWKLVLGEHSRVFVDQSLPDIIKATLTGGGLTGSDYALRLQGAYAPLDFVLQYRESRLTFLTRWLERVGGCYFFEHGADWETLVIADRPSGYGDGTVDAVQFVSGPHAENRPIAGLWSIRERGDVLPRRAGVRDYDELKPLLSISAAADVVTPGPGGDVEMFGVGEKSPGKARAYAATLARQYLGQRTTYRATGGVLGMAPGGRFKIEGHPRSDLSGPFLISEVRHSGSQVWNDSIASGADAYRCEVTAVESTAPWAPPKAVSWPRIFGTVRARVDGPLDDPYAQLDDHGRYLVRLLLDESGLADGQASCRVRMLQPHGGNPEGFHFPLRKGTEVQIAFVRGDPDQPIITGAVPNATTPSPVTRANATQNVLQTGGSSRLEIEDRSGGQYIDWSTPPEQTFMHLGAIAGLGSHNYVFSTQGDFSLHTGTNLDVNVGGTQTETVTGNVTEGYQASQTTTIDGALGETVDGGFSQTVQAGATETIYGGLTQTITGGETHTVTGGQTETLTGGRTQVITGNSTETITGPLSQTITGDATVISPGGHTVSASGGFTLQSSGYVNLIANGGFTVVAPAGQRRLDAAYAAAGASKYEIVSNKQVVLAANRFDARLLYVEAYLFKIGGFVAKISGGGVVRQGALIFVGSEGRGTAWTGFKKRKAKIHVIA
jgi:type VI secretion system secreted protein VgrG